MLQQQLLRAGKSANLAKILCRLQMALQTSCRLDESQKLQADVFYRCKVPKNFWGFAPCSFPFQMTLFQAKYASIVDVGVRKCQLLAFSCPTGAEATYISSINATYMHRLLIKPADWVHMPENLCRLIMQIFHHWLVN